MKTSMITINIICTGKIKEKYLQEAIGEYSKRLSKYCNLNIVELPDEKLPNNLNTSLEENIKQKVNDIKDENMRKLIEEILK